MLYSGATKRFNKELKGLPELVQQDALKIWDEWQRLGKISDKTATPAQIRQRDADFDALAKRIDLKLVGGSKREYRCKLYGGHRAIGKRIADSSGKQRIIFFAASPHNSYIRMLRDMPELERVANAAVGEHENTHQQWRKNRQHVRIKPVQRRALLPAQAPKPIRMSPAMRRAAALECRI